MTNPAIVDCYLRELLAERFGDALEVQDNVYTLPLKTEPRVRLVPATGPGLRVLVDGFVATDLEPGPHLLTVVNELNAGLPYGRLYAIEDLVLVEHTVPGDELTPELLDHAIQLVDWAIRVHGPFLAAELGGTAVTEPQPRLPFVPDAPPADLRDAARPVADAPVPTTADAPQPVGVNAAGYL